MPAASEQYRRNTKNYKEMSKDYLEVNKKLWNEKTTIHVGSDFYEMEEFLAGKNTLKPIETPLLGDVKGKSILHLQCHFGQDSLSLARMGAKVTGLDLSDASISKAQELNKKMGLDAKFVCSDVYSAKNHIKEKFDIVFTSYGTIGWLPDLEELEKEDLSKVKLMWMGYPHMPTGTTATKMQFEKLIAFAKRNNILLINDNPYSFVLNENPTSILSVDGAMDVALELNSLSKTFNMAGWRVGMVLGNEENLKSILKVKTNMDSGMFYGIQKGAIAALGSSQEWFDNLTKVYSARKELMLQFVEKLGCTYDSTSVGMFIWAKLPYGVPSAEKFIDDILYDKDIFITPGTIFGSNGEGYIRFSLCVTEDKIKEAINRF